MSEHITLLHIDFAQSLHNKVIESYLTAKG